jgi:hypothetical protein
MGTIRHIRNIRVVLPEGKNYEIPLTSCLTEKSLQTIDREMKSHPSYLEWMQEAKEMQFISDYYEVAYCRYQYLRNNKIVCTSPSHYSAFPRLDTCMYDINVLPKDLTPFYDDSINYFQKL